MMQWHIVCDFDGTITPTDVIDNILQRFADPSWEAIEDQWLQGAIGSRECLSRQLSLVKASPAELLAYFDTVEIDPDFPDFVDHVIQVRQDATADVLAQFSAAGLGECVDVIGQPLNNSEIGRASCRERV